MIEIIVSTTDLKNKIVLNDDMIVSNISYDDHLDRYDFDYLDESVHNLETSKLQPNKYYQFTFKRKYEDDGSGAMRFDRFELVESIIVT